MRIVRGIGIVVGGLAGLLVLAVGVVYALSGRRFGKEYSVAGMEVAVPADSATLAWGEYIAITRGCTACHAADLGGGPFIDAAVIARLPARNLTGGQGGAAARYASAADWERAIRHGVGPDGRALLFMPSREFYPLSDHDLGALIAWIRARPPVDRVHSQPSVGPLGRILFLTGKFPLVPAELIDHAAPRPVPPTPAVTAEYGSYLAATCRGCHGDGFSGGPVPGEPPEMAIPRNITPDSATGIGRWGLADFSRALRQGLRPEGTPLSKDMPWEAFAHFSDDEVAALWTYLQTVPAKAYGTR